MTRISKAMRNPEGVRVGQTWHANTKHGIDTDVIEITAVYGDLFYVKDKSGKELKADTKRLKALYSLDANNQLF